MATLYTYKDIHTATGLQIDFIRKMHKANLKLFAPYEGVRGDGNSVQFTSSVLTLFDKVKQMKEDNATVPAISAKLEEMVSKGGIQTAEQSHTDLPKVYEPEKDMKWLIEKLEAAHKVTIQTLQDQLQDKERLITAKELHFEDYKRQQLQLTDGKPLEEKLADDRKLLEQEIKKKVELEAEAKRVEEARKDTEASLREAQQERGRVEEALRLAAQEREKAKKQVDDLTQALAEHRTKREEILQKLEQMEGKWFAGKERKMLLAQLRELDTQIENLLEHQITEQI